jgi:two-component system, OmpR family, sensor kinase
MRRHRPPWARSSDPGCPHPPVCASPGCRLPRDHEGAHQRGLSPHRRSFREWLRWLEGPSGTRWLAGRVGHRLHHRLFWGIGVALLVGAGTAWCVGELVPGVGRALPVALGVVVLWAMAGAIARRMTRPVVELVEVTQALGQGEMDRRMRLPRRRFDDMAVVGRAVNAMADRIETQMADQRELLAAVSHELRTPLGHLRVLVDTARERPLDSSIIDMLEDEIIETDRLVDQLLATSRLDFGQVDRRGLSGAELAVRALERLGVDAVLLDIQEESTGLQGDPTLLLSAISNLVRNAETHGGGLRRLSVRREGGLVFEAEDEGPGFEPGTEERAFESFVRGEGRTAGSLGLGLALVRRIAEAHGGRAWAENRTEGGARVGFSVGTSE